MKTNLVHITNHQWNYLSDEATNIINLSEQDRKLMETLQVVNETVQRIVKFQLDTPAHVTC